MIHQNLLAAAPLINPVTTALWENKMKEIHKLEEAKYFYNQMLTTKSDLYPFQYNLSAFLTSSRCVLQYTLKNAKNIGKKSWYDQYVGDNDILKYFKNKRDYNIHEKPNTLTQTFSTILYITGTKVITTSEGKKKYFRPKGSRKRSKTIHGDFQFYDWRGNETVLQLCKKYIRELDTFLKKARIQGIIQE